eukprot:8819505-Pyramimonas_sp.AAC.1
MAAPPHCGTPLTRSPLAQSAWRRRFILARPSHVSWPHKGAPPKVPVAQSAWRRGPSLNTAPRFVAS